MFADGDGVLNSREARLVRGMKVQCSVVYGIVTSGPALCVSVISTKYLKVWLYRLSVCLSVKRYPLLTPAFNLGDLMSGVGT